MSTSGEEARQFAVERAKALCELRRYSEAVATLKDAVASDRHNAYAWALLSHALRETGDADGALGCARTAIGLAPNWEWPHRLASAALRAQVSHGPAVAYARECVRLAPDDWPGYVELALALGAIDACREEAETAAQKATEIAPDESMTHLAVALVASGAGRREAAREAFHRVLAIDPQNAIAHHELARVEVGSAGAKPARLAVAATGFASALRANPGNAQSRRYLDATMRAFLSWTAYFIFLDAVLVGSIDAGSARTTARFVPIALLAVPGAFALRFILRLPPTLRTYLLRLATTGRTAPAVACTAMALVCLVASSLVATPARPLLVCVAGFAALAGRLVLWPGRNWRLRPWLAATARRGSAFSSRLGRRGRR